MRCIIKALFLLCSSFLFTSVAGEAIQTDWSGGPVVTGPVTDWQDRFYLEKVMEWFENSGSLELPVLWHMLPASGLVYSVCVDDMDNDNDMDIVYVLSGNSDDVILLENINGIGTEWLDHLIFQNFTNAGPIQTEDIDTDSDQDIVVASSYLLAWFENEDGPGSSWSMHTVTADYGSISSIRLADIDDDGDIDIIGSSFSLDKLTLWENTEGSGTNWVEHQIAEFYPEPGEVYVADMDGDGDIDIVSYSDPSFEGTIDWWENSDGSGTVWNQYVIDSDDFSPSSIHATDIDGDGDNDVIVGSNWDDKVCWWENINNVGTIWQKHTVGFPDAPRSVEAADFDGDGDQDITVAANGDDQLVWWENLNGTGLLWQKHIFFRDYFTTGEIAEPTDINNDGVIDIVALYGSFCWFSLFEHMPAGSLTSSILDTQQNPDWGILDWNFSTPSGTSISMKVRSSPVWTMYQSEWSDFIYQPTSLDGIFNDGDRYIQYRVFLYSNEPKSTPVLEEIVFSWSQLGIEEESSTDILGLHPFFPNPTVDPIIRFSVSDTRMVEFSIFDTAGRTVWSSGPEQFPSGVHSVTPSRMKVGPYFCRMVSGEYNETQRFAVIE